MSQVSEQQLIEGLKLFEQYEKKEIDFSELQLRVNGHTAISLSDQKLIGFQVTQMASGRLRIRPTSSSALTPLGEKVLSEVNSK